MKCPKYVKDAKGCGRVLGWREGAYGLPGTFVRVLWADCPVVVEYSDLHLEEWPGELEEISEEEYDKANMIRKIINS